MKKDLFKLHLAVALAGMTGIFGKWITLDAISLVWYRLLIAFLVCGVYFVCTHKRRDFELLEYLKIGGVGAVLAVHWFLFYASIKLSNVSVGVICLSSTSFFTAIFAPVLSHKRPSAKEIFFGVSAILGVSLIFSFDSKYRLGIIAGTLCAAGVSLFNILNKKVGERHSASTMLLGELSGGFLFACLVVPFYMAFCDLQSFPVPDLSDALKLFVFAVICTAWIQFLQIQSLQVFSPFMVGLTFCLEPLYSILFAAVFFHEFREWSIALVAGLVLIIIPILLQTSEMLKIRRKDDFSKQ
jgi:drug/metabolite transporter (DMT)-like permease